MSGSASAGGRGVEAVEAALLAVASSDRAALAPPSPLPGGALDLIRVAADDRVLAEELARRHGVDVRLVEDAALHFVHAVMFHPDSDHFRVLGVRPDADEDTLKLHFRWLQKWLHPDRDPGGWSSAYAERVNVAWAQLRRADRREEYRERLRLSPTTDFAGLPPMAGSPPMERGFEPGRVSAPVISSRWARRLPAVVVGAVAVLSVTLFAAHRAGENLIAEERARAGLLADAGRPEPVRSDVEPIDLAPVPVDPSNRPGSTPDRVHSAAPEVGVSMPPVAETSAGSAQRQAQQVGDRATEVLPSVARPDANGTVSSTSGAPVASAVTGGPAPSAAGTRPASPSTSDRAEDEPLASVGAGATPAQADTPDAVRSDAQVVLARFEAPAAPAGSVSDRRPDPVVPVAAVQVLPGEQIELPRSTLPSDPFDGASNAPGDPSSAPLDLDPTGRSDAGDAGSTPAVDPMVGRRLLNQFSSAYREGEVQRVVVLFAPNARTPAGNLLELHRQYGSMFAESSRRSLEFLDLEWRALPNGLEGVGRYEWAMRPRGRSSTEATSGRVRVVIEFVDGQPLIALLDQQDVG